MKSHLVIMMSLSSMYRAPPYSWLAMFILNLLLPIRVVVFDRYTAPPAYSAILLINSVSIKLNDPPNWRYAPPKFEEQSLNNEFVSVTLFSALTSSPFKSA